jgi:TPR repeat protein
MLLALVTVSAGPAEAPKDLEARAAEGEAAAQFEMGLRYASGDGSAKGDARALVWYQKAAAQGYAKAEDRLGYVYAHGFGVKFDWAESVRWYRKAAFQGDPTAQHNLGLDYSITNSPGPSLARPRQFIGLALLPASPHDANAVSSGLFANRAATPRRRRRRPTAD